MDLNLINHVPHMKLKKKTYGVCVLYNYKLNISPELYFSWHICAMNLKRLSM